MQRELKALLAGFFGGGARGRLHVVGQAGQVRFVVDQQFVVIGGVEHVFGKARRDGRVFFLDGAEALFLVFRQLGAAQAEVAHGVVDDAPARRRQAGKGGAGLQLLVFAEQDFILAQFGPEFRHLGLVRIVGGAQLGRVDHAVEVVDDAPGAAQGFADLVQRRDEAVPADFFHRRFELRHGGARLGQQGVDGRRDMLVRNRVEAWQSGKIKQGIGSHQAAP